MKIACTSSVFDDDAQTEMSPDKLPAYGGDNLCAEIDAAFEVLQLEPSRDEFCRRWRLARTFHVPVKETSLSS